MISVSDFGSMRRLGAENVHKAVQIVKAGTRQTAPYLLEESCQRRGRWSR
jgi:hypothetical protein